MTGIRLVVFVAVGLLAACQAAPRQHAGTNINGAHLGIAQAAEESGDYGMAQSILARASADFPADASVQLRYAEILIKQRNIKQARDVLLQHMKTVTDPQMLHGTLGAIYVLQGEPAAALAEFDATKSDEPRWITNKAVALDMLGRHDDAQVLYRRLLATNPDDVVVITDLALSLMLAGRTTEAVQIAAPLTERTDLAPRIQSSLGIVLASNGDFKGAQRTAGTTVSDRQMLRIADAVKSISR